MRTSVVVVLAVVVATSSSISVFAQQGGALNGVAQSADKAPLPNYRVHVRNANTGGLAGSTTSNQAGQFAFDGLQPGNYVVEIVDAAGKVVGLSPSIGVAAGSVVTVTVGATAAGAIAASSGGGVSLLGLGPLASVAVAGAASAAAVTAVVATRDGKIVVCHKVSATVSQTLEINDDQRDSHLGHGDTLGACPASPSR
jgi:Carboxypeptidase regulatory-like domain